LGNWLRGKTEQDEVIPGVSRWKTIRTQLGRLRREDTKEKFMKPTAYIKSTAYIIAAGLLAIPSGGVLAQGSHARSRPGISTLDKSYLKDTAQSNLEEVQFAPVVMSHATNSQDRQFGRQMKQDHGKANADLKRLAFRVGDKLPADVSEDQKALMNKLSHLHGAKFEAAYKQEMIRDHTEDIAKTKREISLGQNPLVKANAQKNLILLQMHLKMSQALPSSGAKNVPGT